jgi:hypothetical protein
MNAKNEFVYITRNREVECATLLRHAEKNDWTGDAAARSTHVLKQDFTQEEYDKFLESLDFEYNSGHGTQELFGMIWFKDRAWAERREYDGLEWWSINERPQIPDNLKRENEISKPL